MTQTYRPGVYSRYQVTYSGTSKLPKTGIFCCGTQKQAGAAVYPGICRHPHFFGGKRGRRLSRFCIAFFGKL